VFCARPHNGGKDRQVGADGLRQFLTYLLKKLCKSHVKEFGFKRKNRGTMKGRWKKQKAQSLYAVIPTIQKLARTLACEGAHIF